MESTSKTNQTHFRLVPFVRNWKTGCLGVCWECYFYGFVDRMPKDNHTCPDCRMNKAIPLCEVSFEEWKKYSGRQEYAKDTFSQFITKVHTPSPMMAKYYPAFSMSPLESLLF